MREGELVLVLPDGVEGRQFDGADHGMSHCMKAVDWVIKPARKLLFDEVKDPASSAARRHEDAERFAKSFQSSDLIPDLVTKFHRLVESRVPRHAANS